MKFTSIFFSLLLLTLPAIAADRQQQIERGRLGLISLNTVNLTPEERRQHYRSTGAGELFSGSCLCGLAICTCHHAIQNGSCNPIIAVFIATGKLIGALYCLEGADWCDRARRRRL